MLVKAGYIYGVSPHEEAPDLPWHGLRHTAATILLNQGISTKNVGGRLGHADGNTTIKIYAHFLKSADKEAADKMENLFSRDKVKGAGK